MAFRVLGFRVQNYKIGVLWFDGFILFMARIYDAGCMLEALKLALSLSPIPRAAFGIRV